MPSDVQARDPDRLVGQALYGQDGDKIGKISELYVDDQTGQPEWVAVNTGWFGTQVSFLPLSMLTERNGELFVPFNKEMVKAAPTAEAEGALSPAEEEELYRYYGLSDAYNRPSTTTGSAGNLGGQETDQAMTRSEEELRVGTQRVEAGRARLRKWVETEHLHETVPVQREEARIVREPITDANIDEATSGPDITENTHEMILHEERPVVGKETVPKERIRLEKQIVTEEQPIEADVRKEQVEVEGDVQRR